MRPGMAALACYQSAFDGRVLHQVGGGDDIVAKLAIGDAPFWIAATGSSTDRVVPRAIGGATGRVLLVGRRCSGGVHSSPRRRCQSRSLSRRNTAGGRAGSSTRSAMGGIWQTAPRLAATGMTIAITDGVADVVRDGAPCQSATRVGSGGVRAEVRCKKGLRPVRGRAAEAQELIAAQQVGDGGDARGDGPFRGVAEAEDELRPGGAAARYIGAMP